MENTGQLAVATVATPGGRVTYAGDARIDGVPGTAAPIPIAFADTAGSSCGALLPTGNSVDVIEGVACTLIDNGMPCVVMRAADVGIAGNEAPEELEADRALRARLEAIRLQAGPMMNLGDVAGKSVPKLTMVSAPRAGGAIATRTFIPHRCHSSIGVLGAVSVATACLLEDGPAASLARMPGAGEAAVDRASDRRADRRRQRCATGSSNARRCCAPRASCSTAGCLPDDDRGDGVTGVPE